MQEYQRALLIVAAGVTIGLMGSAGTANAKQRQVKPLSQVRVTATMVQGRTTKGARVTVMTHANRVLGHAKANQQGRFKVRVHRSVQRVPFKLKVTKKGYLPRTAGYHWTAQPAKPTAAGSSATNGTGHPTMVASPTTGTITTSTPVASPAPTGNTSTAWITWAQRRVATLKGQLATTEQQLTQERAHRQIVAAELTDVREDLASAKRRAAAFDGQTTVAALDARDEVHWLEVELVARIRRDSDSAKRLQSLQQQRNQLVQTIKGLQQKLKGLAAK